MPTFWVYPQPPRPDPPEKKTLDVCDWCEVTGPWIVGPPKPFAPGPPSRSFATMAKLLEDFNANRQARIDDFVKEAWEKAKAFGLCPDGNGKDCKYPWLCAQTPVKMTIGGTDVPPPNAGFYYVVEIWFEVRCRHAEQTGRPPHPPKAAEGRFTPPPG